MQVELHQLHGEESVAGAWGTQRRAAKRREWSGSNCGPDTAQTGLRREGPRAAPVTGDGGARVEINSDS